MAYSKEIQEKLNKLTDKQRNFVLNYTSKDSDTRANALRSYKKAGYAEQRTDKLTSGAACNLLGSIRVKTIIEALIAENLEKKSVKDAITAQLVDDELIATLADCKASGDMTNRVATLRLIGQRIGAYTDKQVTESVNKPDMDASETEQLQEIARQFNVKLASKATG